MRMIIILVGCDPLISDAGDRLEPDADGNFTLPTALT
jgi:hypothetical protein